MSQHLNTIMIGDVLERILELPDEYFHTCVTSPPYWQVRDYKIAPTKWPEINYTLFGIIEITVPAMECQLGLEMQPEHFIGHIVHVFRQVRRVLRQDGTLWMNMGDCYNSKSGGYSDPKHNGYHNYLSGGTEQSILKMNRQIKNMGLKVKDMVGIPWLLAFALRSDGWYLRSDIIWHKQNPMPESVNDRPTKAHEYIFILTKSEKYFYDAYAISTEITDASVKRLMQNIENQKGSDRAHGGMKHNGNMKASLKFGPVSERKAERDQMAENYAINGKGMKGHSGYFDADGNLIGNGRANKKSVWTLTNKGTTEKHYATYPEELPVDPIKAGTSEFGCCAKCGAPWSRTFDKKLVPRLSAPKKIIVDDRDLNGTDQGSNRTRDGHKPGHYYEYSNFAWRPGCECYGKFKPVPFFRIKKGKRVKRKWQMYIPDISAGPPVIAACRVFDPFGGTNTTGIVARKLGRDFVVIEKNSEYAKIGDHRSYKELGMFR